LKAVRFEEATIVPQAIDFTDVSGLSALPLNRELNARVDRATAAAARLPRDYLGASIVGHECARHVQYDWWCIPDLPARVQLIFDRGHAFEALLRAQLIRAGFLFAPPEALAFASPDGCLQGHADGIITSGPAMPGVHVAVPCVWECKALNRKNWRAVNKDGFAKTFPRYATQVAVYQHFLNKSNPALITMPVIAFSSPKGGAGRRRPPRCSRRFWPSAARPSP
jgi:hypothetical protein